MGRLQLFDDNGDSSNDDVSKIEIDHEYGKRLEHNKKREELQRYEELKKQGRVDDSDSEDSSSEEDQEEFIKSSKKFDSKFFDALIKVKAKDPILSNKDVKLFCSDSESESNSDSESERKEKKKKEKKPMYLKDVVSKQLIENGPEYDDEEMENEDNDEMGNMVKSYSEEQEELRKEFLKAVEGGGNDEEGDLLKEKNDGGESEEEEEEIVEKLDKIFGEDDKVDEKEKFLKDYIRHNMWIDDKKTKDVVDDDIELSDDEELIERQEDFEREYNFRFEENAGDRVMGHSRKVDGSVRKKENARKSQRERKEERIAQAEFERKEELKRLKNLKKKEINDKLEKIREVAGIGKDSNIFLNEDDLEEEFNPEEHDRKMKEAFGDEYYKAEDVSPEFGSDEDEEGIGFEKPDFEKEDDLLGLSKGWDEVKEPGENGDDEPEEGKRKRKRKPSDMEKAVREQLMDDYYKLDYEGTVGDLKTRFKYKQVEAKRFGLSPAEILMMDDKDLNQYVPLKKLAPYQEKGWKVPRIKTLQVKEKIKGLYTGETSNSTNKFKKKKTQHDGKVATENDGEVATENDGKGAIEVVSALQNEGSHSTESNDQNNTLSRRSKRRRRQNELKLSLSRHMAYGKIVSKPKSKKK
ncbi:hypothetical protein ACJIZ3_002951 [Penstemon smallii]|uniref:Kri1-like C-terminal domain-containing protein n=1 Tax=Penstemon smallii TaxID=265156 RepID=A0ABD3UAQ4_9LAMI